MKTVIIKCNLFLEVNYMKKSFFTVIAAMVMSMACACAFAFNPGERTMHLLGQTLNSTKHPVHLVIEKTMDMKDIYKKEAYEALPEAGKKRTNRAIFDEANGIYAERSITLDGEGKVLADYTYFCKGGRWYYINFVDKTYDSIPEVYGVAKSFTDTMTGWFNMPPTMGNDPKTGMDFDRLSKETGGALYYFYEKDTNNWKGYGRNVNDMFNVIELSEVVDTEKAFATPPADFTRVPNAQMRNYSNRLFMKK